MSYRKLAPCEIQRHAPWPASNVACGGGGPSSGGNDFEYVVVEPFTVVFAATDRSGATHQIETTVPTGFLSDGISFANRYIDLEALDRSVAWTWLAHDHLYETHELDFHPAAAGSEAQAVELADQVFLAARGNIFAWFAYHCVAASHEFGVNNSYVGVRGSSGGGGAGEQAPPPLRAPMRPPLHPAVAAAAGRSAAEKIAAVRTAAGGAAVAEWAIDDAGASRSR
jgi:hypothetical protein